MILDFILFSFNFEVFDKGYWKAIVPGKDKNIGRELGKNLLLMQ
ncbi:MAG: hypothetical protein R3A12_10815 [Ignavibacteria bacterium]